METESQSLTESGTVLWFEYLLDSSLLEKQLLRENSGMLTSCVIRLVFLDLIKIFIAISLFRCTSH